MDRDADLERENARLQEELRDALDQHRASAEVTRILTRSTFDPKAVFNVIVNKAMELCHADNATLALFDKGRAVVGANAGAFKDEVAYVAAFGNLPLDTDPGTIVGRVLAEKRTVRIPDVRTAGLRRAPGPATGARCVVAAPLLREGDVLGMLVVRRRTEEPFSDRDVHLLEVFADQAVVAIEETRLFRTVKRQSDELCRFVSPQVAALISSDDGAMLLDGHRREITAVFCELRGFTAFSQATEPEEVLNILREYHAAMGELINAHRGTLDHFAGEGLLVFFNDPVQIDRHQRAGVALAVAMRDRAETLAITWRRKGYDLAVAIGVAAGYATLGRIGFEGRYDYGAIGGVVVVAARLALHSKPGQVLVSEGVHNAIEDELEATPIGTVPIGDVRRPVNAFEVAGVR